MSMQFIPGNKAKPAEAITFSKLNKIKDLKIIAAKTVGSGTVLCYTDTVNYYVSDGQALRTWLYNMFKIEP